MSNEQKVKLSFTGHGKSACDGLGGTFERMAKIESLRRMPLNCMFAKSMESNMICKIISKEDHRTEQAKVKYMGLKVIARTRGYHHIMYTHTATSLYW